MTIIYSVNSLVTKIIFELKHKFYLYQNSNFIFIKKQILSLSKIKIYLYQNFI